MLHQAQSEWMDPAWIDVPWYERSVSHCILLTVKCASVVNVLQIYISIVWEISEYSMHIVFCKLRNLIRDTEAIHWPTANYIINPYQPHQLDVIVR